MTLLSAEESSIFDSGGNVFSTDIIELPIAGIVVEPQTLDDGLAFLIVVKQTGYIRSVWTLQRSIVLSLLILTEWGLEVGLDSAGFLGVGVGRGGWKVGVFISELDHDQKL